MAQKKSSLGLLIGVGLLGFLVLFTIVAIAVPEAAMPELFTTVSSLQEFTKLMPESPVRDNKSIVKPEFETFYTSNQVGFFGRTFGNLFRVMGIASPLPWSSKTFASELKKLIEVREKKSYKDECLLHLKTPKNARFIIVGDLQGALHSLTRSIFEWKKMEIIDEQLKIKNETDFIIFLGDAVSRSAYSMETMMILMRMIDKNPEQAFYIRGNHENDNYWQNYGLKRQLEMLAENIQESDEKFPLEKYVQRFFNTLPVALYCDVPSARETQFIRFSHEGGDEYTIEKIEPAKFASFLKKGSADAISAISLKGLSAGDETIETKAIIRSEVKRKSFQSMDGLRQLDPEDGVPSWTVFSAPTTIYQEGVSFFNDAFVILKTTDDLNEWVLTVHFQDVRKLDGYKTRACELISGEEVETAKS